MSDSQQYINNISALSSTSGSYSNAPEQYNTRMRQYMTERNRIFYERRSYLASDYVSAEVQGLTSNFYDYSNTYIRLSDVSTSNVTSLDSKKMDDFKRILFSDRSIDYFPIGAKVITMGSTWLSINPYLLSSPGTQSVIARCNTVYCTYDEYGNIIQEPMVMYRYSMLSNRNEGPLDLVLMAGYFNIICQKNAVTEQLGENSRMILGRKAYTITGYSDFTDEFTGDFDSEHILSFTVRVEEPIADDDLTNRIANGLTYSFAANLSGNTQYTVGQTGTVNPVFIANGQQSSENIPVNWTYTSSAPDIVSIDQNGNVKAVSAGHAQITANLVQNPSISAELMLDVSESSTPAYVAFNGVICDYINQNETVIYKAAYYNNGNETEEPLQWTFSGPEASTYGAEVSLDGKSVQITCFNPSETSLTISAAYNNENATINVKLQGY